MCEQAVEDAQANATINGESSSLLSLLFVMCETTLIIVLCRLIILKTESLSTSIMDVLIHDFHQQTTVRLNY